MSEGNNLKADKEHSILYQALHSLNLPRDLVRWAWLSSHFTDEEAEAQRGWGFA